MLDTFESCEINVVPRKRWFWRVFAKSEALIIRWTRCLLTENCKNIPCNELIFFSILPNPFYSNSDQDRISLYSIDTITRRQVIRIKKKKIPIRGLLIQYQILRNNITRGVWRMVTRITIEICEWEETDPFILEIDLDHLIFKSHSLLQISEIFFWRIRTLSYHVTTILVSCVTLIPWVGGSAYERTRYSCAVMFCFLIMRSSLFTGILQHTCP